MMSTGAFGGRIRVATLQYFLRPVWTFEDFEAQVEGLVEASADPAAAVAAVPTSVS